jgi:hypothetical protein
MHVSADPHALPHAPQFARSLMMSMHAWPHACSSPWHSSVHAPRMQDSPEAHVVPQAPQLPRSRSRSTQDEPQAESGAWQPSMRLEATFTHWSGLHAGPSTDGAVVDGSVAHAANEVTTKRTG